MVVPIFNQDHQRPLPTRDHSSNIFQVYLMVLAAIRDKGALHMTLKEVIIEILVVRLKYEPRSDKVWDNPLIGSVLGGILEDCATIHVRFKTEAAPKTCQLVLWLTCLLSFTYYLSCSWLYWHFLGQTPQHYGWEISWMPKWRSYVSSSNKKQTSSTWWNLDNNM